MKKLLLTIALVLSVGNVFGASIHYSGVSPVEMQKLRAEQESYRQQRQQFQPLSATTTYPIIQPMTTSKPSLPSGPFSISG